MSRSSAQPYRLWRLANRLVAFTGALAASVGLMSCGAESASIQRAADAPNILLISIDTLRARNLGSWGYDRNTSPWLDELASRGVRFASAYVNTHGTTPSHATMLSSRYQESHGVALDGDPKSALPDGLLTLAEVLGSQGYRTLAVTGGGNVGASFGFAQGFDIFDDSARNVESGTRKLLAHLDSLPPDGLPVFAFYHTYEVHSPYAAPPAYDDLFGQFESPFEPTSENLMAMANTAAHELQGDDLLHVVERYDAGIRHTDDVLRDFWKELEKRGFLDDALIVVTSDHGEELVEHGGVLHRALLFDELLHVPLVVAGRDLPQGKIDFRLVSSVDIVPTLLQCAGIEIPETVQGRPLLCGVEDPAGGDDEAVISQYGQLLYSVRTSEWKLIESTDPARIQLFRLAADPGERRNLAPENLEIVKELRKLLFDWKADQDHPTTSPAEADLSEEETARLRALGYLGEP